MLNRIWFWLLVIGVLYGFGKATYFYFTGAPLTPPAAQQSAESSRDGDDQAADEAATEEERSPEEAPAGVGVFTAAGESLTEAALEGATLSVTLAIGLIGVMALWLGMLRIASDAGLVDALAYALRPLMRWLFPDVPDGHPAQGAMLMNISANMLGLDNAATPFGLHAMRELQEINPRKDTATDAMATFLAINTSNVTLLPISIIALRVASGSESPASPILPMFFVTLCSTIVAVVVVRWLARRPAYALPPPPADDLRPQEEGGPDA